MPACRSNYGKAPHITVFKFPKEKTLREKWPKKIHRDNFEVNDKRVVCVKHFESKFVVRDDVFPVLNGIRVLKFVLHSFRFLTLIPSSSVAFLL